MKKLIALVLTAVMMLCSVAFAQSEDNSLQAILDKGTLVLGLDATFEPMGYTNLDGEIVRASRVSLRVADHKLRFVVPRGETLLPPRIVE